MIRLLWQTFRREIAGGTDVWTAIFIARSFTYVATGARYWFLLPHHHAFRRRFNTRKMKP